MAKYNGKPVDWLRPRVHDGPSLKTFFNPEQILLRWAAHVIESALIRKINIIHLNCLLIITYSGIFFPIIAIVMNIFSSSKFSLVIYVFVSFGGYFWRSLMKPMPSFSRGRLVLEPNCVLSISVDWCEDAGSATSYGYGLSWNLSLQSFISWLNECKVRAWA